MPSYRRRRAVRARSSNIGKALQQAIRHRVELPSSQAGPRIHQFSGRRPVTGDVCREPAAPEQLAVSSLEVRGGGRSRSSVRWCCEPLGQRLVSAGLFQRISHSTTGSSGSCPRRTAVVSGNTVAGVGWPLPATPLRRNPQSVPSRESTTHRRCRFKLYWRD